MGKRSQIGFGRERRRVKRNNRGKMGRPVKLTKDEIKFELLKCGRNCSYFVKNYVRISHPERGIIPFKLFDYQDEALQDFNNYRFNVILKARQLGMSTTVAGYITWLILFHRAKEVMVVATKFKTASNLVKKVKAMIKRLPKWIRIATIKVDNQTSFILSNDSQVQASTTSEDAGRSEALSLLVVDEAAHIPTIGDLWKGIYPTLSTGGRCISLSTPNGCGNWFHQVYTKSTLGENDFHSTKLLWDAHPERDQAWFEHETRNMSKKDIAQELLCDFLMSGETVFDSEDIKRIESEIKDPVYKTGFDRNLYIWEEYDPNFSYLMACDVARGDGADYSTFHILKLETMQIVAEYRGKLPTDMFSNFINQIGKQYGDCLLVVENNSIGYAVLRDLIDLEYPNLYWSTKSTHEYVEQYEAEGRTDCVPGFTMSAKTRPLILSKLEEFVRNNLIKFYSKRMVEEMRTFVWENGKPTAMRNYNDDLVLSAAIAVWIKETALQICIRDLAYKKAFLCSVKTSTTTLDTRIPGMPGAKMTMGAAAQKEVMDKYPWLFPMPIKMG